MGVACTELCKCIDCKNGKCETTSHKKKDLRTPMPNMARNVLDIESANPLRRRLLMTKESLEQPSRPDDKYMSLRGKSGVKENQHILDSTEDYWIRRLPSGKGSNNRGKSRDLMGHKE